MPILVSKTDQKTDPYMKTLVKLATIIIVAIIVCITSVNRRRQNPDAAPRERCMDRTAVGTERLTDKLVENTNTPWADFLVASVKHGKTKTWPGRP